MAITQCEDCGVLTEGREFCSDCETTAIYVYSTGQMKAATPPAETTEPEAV